MSADTELLVVLPIYNEQASLKKVVTEWMLEVENWTDRFVLLAIDDGSTDNSLAVLRRLQQTFGSRLEVLSRENRGHGQTCLQGYRIACERGIPFVFQIDSDGQCDPQYFFRLWRIRDRFDVVYGHRTRRDDGWRRVLATRVLKLSLLWSSGVRCVDPNVPYRLMSTAVCRKAIDAIPPGFFLANVALAVLLRKDRSVRQGVVEIGFRERYGGEPAVPLPQFQSRARQLMRQLRELNDRS